MDAAKAGALATSKEDAVFSQDSKEMKTNKQDDSTVANVSATKESAGSNQKQQQQQYQPSNKINENLERELTTETDDLLEKIEEVVKGDIELKSDVAISQASEQDFLKKIDEEMRESGKTTTTNSKILLTNKTSSIKGNCDSVDKTQLDGVIVNKEIFAIEDDNGVSSNVTENLNKDKNKDDNKKLQKNNEITIIKNIELKNNDKKQNEDISVSSTSNTNEQKINQLKRHTNLEIFDEAIKRKVVEPIKSTNQDSNAQVTTTTTTSNVNQLNKVFGTITKKLDNKSDLQAISSTLGSQIPINLELIKSALTIVQQHKQQQQQQQQSLDLSLNKNEEIMCIDSSESSNDGKMDIDTEDKSEMDIDNGNGGDNVVYNDTEIKTQDKKAQNVLEIQHKISPIKLQLDTGSNLNSPVKSFPQITKDNISEIKVKVNVDIGLTGNLNQSDIKEIEKTSVENVNKNSPVKIVDVTEKTTEIQKSKEQSETNKQENLEVISLKSSPVKEKMEITASEKLQVKDKTEVTTVKSPIKDKVETVTTVKSPVKETVKITSITPNSRQKINSIENNQNIPKNIVEKLDVTKEDQQKILQKSPEKSQRKEISDKSVKDSPISEISAPSTVTVANVAKVNDEDDMKIENKILSKLKEAASKTPTISTPDLKNSPIPPQANVFNSTPIVKQFEISSENVSKISDALEHSRNDQNVSVTTVATAEIIPEASTSGQAKQTTSSTSTTSETGSSYQTSETENQSSGVVSKFINSIKNGIADSTTDDGAAGTTGSNSKTIESPSGTSSLEANKVNEEDNMYEVNLWCEKNDVKFLSVKRLDKTITGVVVSGAAVPTVGQQSDSSNGSVSSLPQFSLPSQRSDTIATMTLSSSGSTTESGEKTADLTTATAVEVNKTKHLIKGLSELCAFMINHFTKIRSTLPGHRKEEDAEGDELMEDIGTSGRSKKRQLLTPSKYKATATKRVSNRQQQRQSQSPAAVSDSSSPVSKEGRSSKMSCESPLSVGGKSAATSNETPSRKTEGRARKRSIGKMISDDDEEPKAKQAKKTQQPSQHQGQGDGLGQCVLAKWVDKKYYAGRILEAKPANKFVVRFEDGASKVLQKDLIVFGNDDGTLPLKDHKIHALVDDDYECGTVISIDKIDNKVLYTVKAETATVKVTASDIYLQDDQAKIIQNLQNSQQLESIVGGGGIGGVSGALSTAQDLSLDTSSSRHTRHKRISGGSPITTITTVSPEPGTSGGGKKTGRRQKRSETTGTVLVTIRKSESSDITDTSTKSSQSGEESDLEPIEGIQQEYQRTPQEIQDQRMIFVYEFRNLNLNYNIDELIGVLPTVKSLFKNKCFLLTCTAGLKPHLYSKLEQPRRNIQFSRIPFVRNFLEYQIIEGGGKIYKDFKDIPTSKYRSCILIAPRPCCTAKYIQCLAANIQAISHEWIIDCCRNNFLLKKNDYYLPAGWSIILNKFIRWTKGKTDDQRLSTQPFLDIYILIGSEHEQFISLWSNICKLAGAIIRYVKNLDDITPSTKGYMVIDSDFSDDIKRKAEYYGIPIVSSVWIVQSLIAGKILPPQSHIKLSCIYSEDDDM